MVTNKYSCSIKKSLIILQISVSGISNHFFVIDGSEKILDIDGY